MINNIIIYNLILFISVLFSLLASTVKDKGLGIIFCGISFLAITIPSIIRFDLGPDYKGYFYIFKEIYNFGKDMSFIEVSYFYINKFFSFSEYGYVYILAIYFIISLSFFYLKIEKEKAPLTVFLFMTLNVGYFSFDDQVRQVLAICIYSLSIKYIYKRDIYKYVIVVFLAGLIHKSAFALFPFYFLSRVNVPRNISISLILVFTIIFFSGVSQTLFSHIFKLVPYYDKYAYRDEYISASQATGSGFGVLLNVVLFSLCVFYKDKIGKDIEVNLLFIGILLLLFSSGNLNISRFAKYFLFVGVFLLAEVFYKLKNRSIMWCMMLLLFLLFQKTIIHRAEINLSYQTIFGDNFREQVIRNENR